MEATVVVWRGQETASHFSHYASQWIWKTWEIWIGKIVRMKSLKKNEKFKKTKIGNDFDAKMRKKWKWKEKWPFLVTKFTTKLKLTLWWWGYGMKMFDGRWLSTSELVNWGGEWMSSLSKLCSRSSPPGAPLARSGRWSWSRTRSWTSCRSGWWCWCSRSQPRSRRDRSSLQGEPSRTATVW